MDRLFAGELSDQISTPLVVRGGVGAALVHAAVVH
jgi:hypothetical protein